MVVQTTSTARRTAFPMAFHRVLIVSAICACSSIGNFGSDAFSIVNNGSRGGSSTKSALRATWSNGQAILEYQDFLASGKSEPNESRDSASVIVVPTHSPPSPIAVALLQLGSPSSTEEADSPDIVLQPFQPLPPTLGSVDSYPIYITIPPSDLPEFIRTLPEEWKDRRDDFVFLSGGPLCGCIERTLKGNGYARDTMTQLLVTGMSVAQGGEFNPKKKVEDVSVKMDELAASGVEKWAGECAVCGKWAKAVEERLVRGGIRCRTGFYREWRRIMWERAAYDAVFPLIGAIRAEPTTINNVAAYYYEEASDMLWEISSALRGMLAVTLLFGFEERLFTMADRKLPYEERQCEILGEGVAYGDVFCPPLEGCKMIGEYLNYAVDERGLKLGEGVVLPRMTGDVKSVMRQGNLRSDGVI